MGGIVYTRIKRQVIGKYGRLRGKIPSSPHGQGPGDRLLKRAGEGGICEERQGRGTAKGPAVDRLLCRDRTAQGHVGIFQERREGYPEVSGVRFGGGTGIMEENQDKEIQKEEPAPVKKEEEQLPYCTQAASAEHARAELKDEPCDDGRAGDYKRK